MQNRTNNDRHTNDATLVCTSWHWCALAGQPDHDGLHASDPVPLTDAEVQPDPAGGTHASRITGWWATLTKATGEPLTLHLERNDAGDRQEVSLPAIDAVRLLSAVVDEDAFGQLLDLLHVRTPPEARP